MKIVRASYEIISSLFGIDMLQSIERAGRVCYKSEDKITEESAPAFVAMLIKRGHEAMIEHGPSIAVKFTVDRGVSHEMVRHRIASFAQESTRYCNYGSGKFGKEITVIEPIGLDDRQIEMWKSACSWAEHVYLSLLEVGLSPQMARSVLPNSLKTEIIITANPREWRHILKLRAAEAAHPQMREVMIPLCRDLQSRIPILFDDIEIREA
jgi:thymidylate synthase (FAD)